MTELPTGWSTATVGDIAELTDGPFGSNLKTAHYTESGPRIVRLQNIGEGSFRDERAHITQEHYEQLAKHAVRPGDVLAASFGQRAPRACLVPDWLGPAIVKADCIRVRTHDVIAPGFLMWMLNSPPVRKQASSSIKGIGRPRLGLGGIRQLDIPLPPLNEQRRIAAAIEEQFSRLDAADATLTQARSRLNAMRGSVIDAAARTAIDRWGMSGITDVCSAVTNGNTPPANKMTPAYGDVPFIKVYNLTMSGTLDFSKRPTFIDRETHEGRLGRSRLYPGDVLTNIVGPPLGKVAVVPTTHPEWNTNQAVVAFRPKGDLLESRLLAIWLQARRVIGPLLATAKATAGQFNLSLSACRRLEVPVPPLHEQQRILAEVEQQLSLIDAMRDAIAIADRRSTSLRRSILEHAFRGELVAQDAADEPASVLLERLVAERAAAAPKRRRRVSA
jgi:type I restriction enzyme S subunit